MPRPRPRSDTDAGKMLQKAPFHTFKVFLVVPGLKAIEVITIESLLLYQFYSKRPFIILYGNMEKVGPLGTSLPTNDEQITTQAGDIILYQGNNLVIYYAPNSYHFTRLGRINNVTAQGLRDILGDGSVSVTLSLG